MSLSLTSNNSHAITQTTVTALSFTSNTNVDMASGCQPATGYYTIIIVDFQQDAVTTHMIISDASDSVTSHSLMFDTSNGVMALPTIQFNSISL